MSHVITQFLAECGTRGFKCVTHEDRQLFNFKIRVALILWNLRGQGEGLEFGSTVESETSKPKSNESPWQVTGPPSRYRKRSRPDLLTYTHLCCAKER